MCGVDKMAPRLFSLHGYWRNLAARDVLSLSLRELGLPRLMREIADRVLKGGDCAARASYAVNITARSHLRIWTPTAWR